MLGHAVQPGLDLIVHRPLGQLDRRHGRGTILADPDGERCRSAALGSVCERIAGIGDDNRQDRTIAVLDQRRFGRLASARDFVGTVLLSI